jgi:hypothetical protein
LKERRIERMATSGEKSVTRLGGVWWSEGGEEECGRMRTVFRLITAENSD